MTTKDLFLVALVGGIAGFAAAFGAAAAHDASTEPAGKDDLATRLDRIETALARAAENQKDAKESVTKLNERVSALQIDVATAHEDAVRAKAEAAADPHVEPTARPGRARRPILAMGADGRPLDTAGAREPVRLEFNTGDSPFAGVLTDAIGESLKARLAGLNEGFKLRMLPQAERWKKAQDDLHLTDSQVENLKKAVADRDTAIKDSMQIETNTENGSSNITIRRMDPAKAAAAQQEYDRKVTDALDSEQKKSWDAKGYHHAFGGGGGGQVMIAQSIDFNGGPIAPANGSTNDASNGSSNGK